MVQLETRDVSDERVEVGDGVTIPASWVVVLRDEPDVPGEIFVRADYDLELKRAVASEVRVLRAGQGDEVTSLTLREVRVQSALQASGLALSRVSEPGHPIETGADYIRRMRAQTDRTLTQSLVDATRTYQLAAAVNLPPLRYVADGLHVSQSTATRLMNRARQEGLAPGVNLPDPRAAEPVRRRHATGPVVGPPTSGGPSIG